MPFAKNAFSSYFTINASQRCPTKKDTKKTSQLQIARSARRKYQCKNLRSSVRKMTVAIKHETDPRIIRFFTGPADRSFAPPGFCADMGLNKKWSFYYPFPAESVYCKENLRTFRKLQEHLFFFVVSPFWSCAHIYLRHSVSHAWVQTFMLHCGIWGLTNIPAAAIHRKKPLCRSFLELSARFWMSLLGSAAAAPQLYRKMGLVPSIAMWISMR